MRSDDTMKGREWQLMLGGDLVTGIVQTSYEFPWTYGDVTDLDAFNRVRPYFRDPDEWPDTIEFDVLTQYIEQNGGFALHDVRENTTYRPFTLNADYEDDSATVWFRHSTVEAIDAESDVPDES